jgi:hypothetical protein
VCVKSLDKQLSETGKARGIYGVVRNAYRMWSENIKSHVRNLSLSGRILINVYVHIYACACTHAYSHSTFQYTVNFKYNESAYVIGIRLINQDKNIKL